MRIKQLHIYGFGHHTNRIIQLDEEFNLLYGLNEAGKTTIYEFILQIFFGFPQKNHLIKSYEPKNGGAFGGQIEVIDEEHGSYTVERIGGRAGGVVKVYLANGQVGDEALLNQLLRGYTRSDIEAVFAFSMHQLQNLEKMTEDDLNRTLLASGTTGVEQLTAIEKQVAKESSALFKRSGQNPVINKLIKELEQQDSLLKLTRQKLAEYEPKHLKIEELEAEIIALEQQQASLGESIKQAQIYLQSEPLIKQKKMIMSALAEQKNIDFPQKGVQIFEQNEMRLQQLQQDITQLQRRLADLDKEVAAVVDEEKLQKMKVLYRSDEQWREWRMQRDRLLSQQQKLEVQLEMKKQLLGLEKRATRIDSSLTNEVVFKKRLNEIKELQEQISYYDRIISETKNDLHNAKANAEYSRQNKKKNKGIMNMPVTAAVIVGGASIIVGIVFQQWLTMVFGIVMAIILFVILRNQMSNTTVQTGESDSQLIRKKLADLSLIYEQLNAQKAEKQQELQGYFNELGVTGAIEEEIYEELFQNIRSLQEQTVEQEQIDSELDSIQQNIAEYYDKVCSVLMAEVREEELSPLLQQRIHEQEMAMSKLAFSIEKRDEMKLQLTNYNEQQAAIGQQQDTLLKKVGVQDANSFYEMAQLAEDNKQLQQQLLQIEQQLGVSDVTVMYTASQLDELQARYELNKNSYKTALKELSLSKAEVQHLVKDNHYSVQLQQQEQLKGELNANIKKWVQLKMIEESIAKSLESLKEQKLPKVLLQATGFFSYLTNERYQDLVFEGEKFVAITADNLRFSIDELSQATKEQAYLSLRLALANEKAKTAPFPFILDDPFVHFDTLRTAKVVQLLGKIQKEHQILFFSCQERMKKDFKEQNIIEVRALQTKGD